MKTSYIGVFHLYIAQKLKEKCDPLISTRVKYAAVRKLLYIYHVPLKYHYDFLKEMAGYNLIRICDKQNIELL